MIGKQVLLSQDKLYKLLVITITFKSGGLKITKLFKLEFLFI